MSVQLSASPFFCCQKHYDAVSNRGDIVHLPKLRHVVVIKGYEAVTYRQA